MGVGQKKGHLRGLGWVKAWWKGYRPGTRGWTRPARVVRHCTLLPVHIHTLLHPSIPFILLLAKAIILLKKGNCLDFEDNNVQGVSNELCKRNLY